MVMILVGLIWAVLAPLLLLLPAGVLAFAFRAAGWPARRRERWALSLVMPVLVVMVFAVPDRLEFERLCDAKTQTQIHEKRVADGFFLDDSTAHSFGMRYLQEEGFQWIEARSIYRRDGFTRYEKGPQGITSKEVPQITAELMVQTVRQDLGRASFETLLVKDRASGKLLAQASNGHFNGGRMFFVLGAYGSASCPHPATPAGAQAFQQFYHLAKLTLRP